MSDPEPTSGVPRAVLLALSAAFVALGVAFLLAPAKLAAHAGVTTSGKLGLVELRAFYGGIQIGLGVFLAVAAMRREWQLPGLLCALLSLLGVAGARIYGMTVEGWPGAMVLVFLAIELGGVVLAGFGLLRFRRTGSEATLEHDVAALRAEKTKVIDKTLPLDRTARLEPAEPGKKR
jgi:hypothetical protein